MKPTAAAITALALIVSACGHGGGNGAPASSAVMVNLTSHACADTDMATSIVIRHPSQQQVSVHDWAHVHSQHPVTTVLVRNVSGHPCTTSNAAFKLKIFDRHGKLVAVWDDPDWFAGSYTPGDARTFSLPAVMRCDRTPPFNAVAVVGDATARRRGLQLDQVTCIHGVQGKE